MSAVTAYNCPRSHTTYILVFNEILYYGTALDHSLINPNQVCHYGIGYWDNPFDPDHGLQIDICDDIVIPLQRQGTVIGFETRVPTDDELNTCEHIYMTSAQPWDPQQVQYNLWKRNQSYQTYNNWMTKHTRTWIPRLTKHYYILSIQHSPT